MKNYQYLSTETLNTKRDNLLSDIKQWEKLLSSTRSALIRLSLSHYIRKAKDEIHLIDAELCFRDSGKMNKCPTKNITNI